VPLQNERGCIIARIIDADSHFMEPLDLFERYIEPKLRDRAYKVEKDSTTASGGWSLTTNRSSCSTSRSC